MADKQLTEIMDMAIQFETDANEFYLTASDIAKDPSAKTLLKELATIELKHKEKLEEFNLDDVAHEHHTIPETHDLHVSDYLMDKEITPTSTSQDIMVHAMKREQKAYEFYARMLKVVTSGEVKILFEELAAEELEHKAKIETEYDDVVYKEN
ncbi:MAG: ferritin family protein [Candidatus Scalindua sp.]|jgi:rubrerythrin|nr:ferritin family protein [Candidatus Scalindua sp.]MBT5306915.1 ferritin family protein [Candidatus Scalindua sp.]MBT6048995.1 ferritin family protein [Candidatus Scalindua sp.]MBT6229295.1 ferritin family protein [Candidatus Scalindua sp.]MBT6561136.1 ferritin family protein [Candidatus Scalindua sp.]